MSDEKSNVIVPDYRISEQESCYENKEKANFADGQLCYAGHDADHIPASIIQTYAHQTRRLDLSYNSIRSLDGLESFKHLEELVLDNNELTDDIVFPSLPKLRTLTLNKNRISHLDHLLYSLSQNCSSLTYLSLLGNLACPNQLSSSDKDEEDYTRYRYYVLYKLPKLLFLDSSSVKAAELAEAKRIGPFMNVVRGDDSGTVFDSEDSLSSSSFNPLPANARQDGQHIGTFGTCRYVYYGKHSEGNRFIRNNDL